MIEVDEMTERTLKRIQAEVSEGVRGAVIEGNQDIARGFDRLQKSLQQESTTGQNVIKRSADALQDELLQVKEDVLLQIEDFSQRFKAMELDFKIITAMEAKLVRLEESIIVSKSQQLKETHSLRDQLGKCEVSIGNQLTKQISEIDEKMNSLHELVNVSSSSVRSEMAQLNRSLELKLIAAQEERLDRFKETYLMSQDEQQKQTHSLCDQLDQYAASSGNRLTEHITEVNARFNSLQELVNVSSSSIKSEMGQLSQTIELVRKEILWISQPFYKRWFGRRQGHA